MILLCFLELLGSSLLQVPMCDAPEASHFADSAIDFGEVRVVLVDHLTSKMSESIIKHERRVINIGSVIENIFERIRVIEFPEYIRVIEFP